MLRELIVRQFALMDEVQLQFEEGMTVFTGETGAGKSILVDALGAVFGARASSDWVRHGSEKAEVVATLENSDVRLKALLEEQDMDTEDELILRRVIQAGGGSKAWINGMPAPSRLLQQIGEICLDLHGQHEHQALMHADFQLQVVDSRLPPADLQRAAEAYEVFKKAERTLASFKHEQQDNEQQELWMRDELKRLHVLDLEEGVVSRLMSEVDAGRHLSQIQQAAAQALAALDEGEVNARSLVAEARHAVESAAAFHESLQEAAELIGQLDVILSEVEPNLRHALDATFDPAQLEAAESRLMDIHDAMRRHHVDEAGLISLMEDWQAKVEQMETADWDEEKLRHALHESQAVYRNIAEKLTEQRQQAAQALTKSLRPFLDRLGLKGMQVEIVVTPHSKAGELWHANGWDSVEFMASSNPGEPFKPLAAIASGGELSRFVLALKGCGALEHAPQVAVFDEVDVGIGGETAWCVGELLAAMGRERQVLVVSHLPQVASCADHQICIEKGVVEGRTITRMQQADSKGRLQEIARMLGGVSKESMEHASQMLERGRGLQAERA